MDYTFENYVCLSCKCAFRCNSEQIVIVCEECGEVYGRVESKKYADLIKRDNVGVSITTPGIGDGVQFTSLFENYYLQNGKKLIDVSKPWFLDYNPYVIRNVQPKVTIEMWNYQKWLPPRDTVYLSNAEIHASAFEVKHPSLIRPRLYQFEDYRFEDRKMILFHPYGRSHGQLPQRVIDHVIKKYKPTKQLVQVGGPNDPSISDGIPQVRTETLWDLAKIISMARMFIGVDSGPAWIAACYPDVVLKKIRTKFQFSTETPSDWVPLNIHNPHSFWDDRAFQTYNCTDKDMGFTQSYLKV